MLTDEMGADNQEENDQKGSCSESVYEPLTLVEYKPLNFEGKISQKTDRRFAT